MQRVLIRRALAGQQPQSPQEIITWLEDTVAGWNATPTPFVWDGPRRRRRERARLRRLGGSADERQVERLWPTFRATVSSGVPGTAFIVVAGWPTDGQAAVLRPSPPLVNSLKHRPPGSTECGPEPCYLTFNRHDHDHAK